MVVDFRGIVAFRPLVVVVCKSGLLFDDRSYATKVNYLDPCIHVRELEWSINHDVLKLQVKVEQSQRVHVLDTLQYLTEEEAANTLAERSIFDHVKKLPASIVL